VGRFQPALDGTLHLGRTNAFFLGGGKALVNAYYRTAAAQGVAVLYEAEVQDLRLEDGCFTSATVVRGGATHQVRAKALVAAAGGSRPTSPGSRSPGARSPRTS
jgi:tricarballylate dehydrogenase